jgi:hypothetical protein
MNYYVKPVGLSGFTNKSDSTISNDGSLADGDGVSAIDFRIAWQTISGSRERIAEP